jgi:XisH protein
MPPDRHTRSDGCRIAQVDGGPGMVGSTCTQCQCEVVARSSMPAKDRYHDVVVRALQKDGWTILAEQVALSMPTRRVWIDIRASKNAGAIAILVEVKGF